MRGWPSARHCAPGWRVISPIFAYPAPDNAPIALGERLFHTAVPTCQACHSMAPGVNLAGPSLAGMGAMFEKIKASGEYKGKATLLAADESYPTATATKGGRVLKFGNR